MDETRKRRSASEQLRLIEECHKSGMTEAEWCMDNGIPVGTFYSWLYRAKKKGVIDKEAVIAQPVPSSCRKQDIVKIQIEGERSLSQSRCYETLSSGSQMQHDLNIPVMEILVNGIQFKVSNGTDPRLLAETIQLIRGLL